MAAVGAPRSSGVARGWGALAHLPVCRVAREHGQLWAEVGLPDELADLEVPLGAAWAGVELALWGADRQGLVVALGLDADVAEKIIVATTEQLLAPDPTLPAGGVLAE